jgi:hypothetical protein
MFSPEKPAACAAHLAFGRGPASASLGAISGEFECGATNEPSAGPHRGLPLARLWETDSTVLSLCGALWSEVGAACTVFDPSGRLFGLDRMRPIR